MYKRLFSFLNKHSIINKQHGKLTYTAIAEFAKMVYKSLGKK
jgi:hypothetical protein